MKIKTRRTRKARKAKLRLRPTRSIFCLAFILLISAASCHASPDKAGFISRVTWKGDGQGDYTFEKDANLLGTGIADDGAVEYLSAPGIYELKSNHTTNAMITGISATYMFTGEVTLEVSATGNTADYVELVNGVPLEWGAFTAGSSIKWRATLAEGSRLTKVSIAYTDINSVIGSFGNPKLSGFMFRKPIYITRGMTLLGAPEGGETISDNLFHCQVPITVGESSKAEGRDVYLTGVIQAGFYDVRFTLADQETLIPHWRESGAAEKFWVKIPQIPKEGILIYLYYGNSDAKDLSDGEAVFAFFDDFSEGLMDIEKWSAYDFHQEEIIEYKAKASEDMAVLNAEGLTTERIIALFTPVSDYDWIRARGVVDFAPGVDTDKTKEAREEVPNLPEFRNVAVAPNGNLVLEDNETEGEYISQLIHSSFKTRIMVPSWMTAPLSLRESAGTISIDISAKEYGVFNENCKNDSYYYASTGDFSEGETLRWRARFYSKDAGQEMADAAQLKEFTMDFRPGVITVTSPDGGEKLLVDQEYEVLWTAWEYESSYGMKLEYSGDGGETYQVIADNRENDGRYTWVVPSDITTKGLIRISDALEGDIYDISNSNFSIVLTLEEEEIEEELEETIDEEIKGLIEKYLGEEAEEAVDQQSYAKPHEMLVKVGKEGSASYKEGDIVMIKPAGHTWGADELNTEKFVIVKVYLAEEEAAELMASLIIGNKTIKRRKHKVNLEKQGIIKKNIFGKRRLIQNGLLLDIDAVETKSVAEEKKR